MKLIPCVTVGVIALVAITDAWLLLFHPLAHVPTVSLDRGELFNALSVYPRDKSTPEIVLLGSSAVTAPLMQAEALFFNEPITRFSHRRCHYLEHMLAQRLGRQPQVFCLASGGQMASDAYLIARHISRLPKHPVAIVYGITPRDFQDNLLPSITSSETFQLLAGFEDLPKLLSSPRLDLEHKASLILGRVWALWRYRSDIRTYLVLKIKKTMERTLPFVVFDKYGDTRNLKPHKYGQFPEEARGTPHAWPGLPLDHLSSEQTQREYSRRYNPVSQELVEEEFCYFRELLKLCQNNHITLLVVNMPLSNLNKNLMAPGFYNKYVKKLEELSHSYNIDFIDMNQKPLTEPHNFVDTVHLTPQSGLVFLKALSNTIAKSPVSRALINSPPAVANHSQKPSL